MKLENLFYTLEDLYLYRVFGIHNKGNLMMSFKKHVKNMLNKILEEPTIFLDIMDYSNGEFEQILNFIDNDIDGYVDYLYETNNIEQFFSILPKRGANTALNTTVHYHQLFYSDNVNYLNLMEKLGCHIEPDIDGNCYVYGMKVLGSGTFGTALLIESSNSVLKISSDEDEQYKDVLFFENSNNSEYVELLKHFPKIYSAGNAIYNWSYMLPTTQNIIDNPIYSIKEYIQPEKVSGSTLNSLFKSEYYVNVFEKSLVEFGEEFGIHEWDIHQDNLSVVGGDRSFIYFDY